MRRREFLKASCTLCAAMSLAGLSSCAPLPIHETEISEGAFNIPVGSFDSQSFLIVRAKGIAYDIGVRKNVDGSFEALLLRCTHADYPLTSTGQGYRCGLHGSVFDPTGAVTTGPATEPLKSLRAEKNGEMITVKIDNEV